MLQKNRPSNDFIDDIHLSFVQKQNAHKSKSTEVTCSYHINFKISLDCGDPSDE